MYYPRDLTGYGDKKPEFLWPNDSVIAVQFVVNYEEGGENNILHGDEGSDAFLSEIIGAQPWKAQKTLEYGKIMNTVQEVSGV